jgi:hypothetical protein
MPGETVSALLRMVLVNLISNAVKFTGARAEAKIEIGCASACVADLPRLCASTAGANAADEQTQPGMMSAQQPMQHTTCITDGVNTPWRSQGKTVL